MKKIFKKSLAIMVSAAICLTALIGCLSVSAATRGEGTFTVGSVSGKAGASVTVPIELKYTSGGEGMGIAASLFDVSFDTDALTITDIAAGEDAKRDPGSGDLPGGDGVPPQDIYTVEYRSTDGETISVVDGAVRILAMPADNETVLTSMTVNLTFTINEGAAAQDYAITITKQQTCDYGQATPDGFGSFTYADNEEFIAMSITEGAVTVVKDVTEPVLDESISAIRAIRIQDTVGVSYLVPKAAMSKYADFRIEIKYNKFDGDYNYTQTSMIINKSDDEAPAEGVVHGFTFPGVGMYEMNNELEAVIYALDGEGNVVAYSNTFKDSIVALAKNLYSTTDSVKTKTLITDLLNMGAEAQKYFVAMKPNSDLASVPLANEGFDQTYATAEISKDDLNTIFSNDVIKGDISMVNALSFAGSPCVSYVITGVSNYDVSKLSLTVSYRDDYAGKDVSVTLNGNEIAFGGSMCIYAFSNTALYDGNKVVTAELSYDGEVYIRNTCTVEKILSDKFDDPTTSELAKSTAKFGKSAREYFGIN